MTVPIKNYTTKIDVYPWPKLTNTYLSITATTSRLLATNFPLDAQTGRILSV